MSAWTEGSNHPLVGNDRASNARGKNSGSSKDEVADFELSDKTHLIIVKLPGNQIPQTGANILTSFMK